MKEGEEWGVSSRSGGDGHGLRNPPLTLFFPVGSCPIWNDMKKWTHPN